MNSDDEKRKNVYTAQQAQQEQTTKVNATDNASTVFWTRDPNVIFASAAFFPVPAMTLEEKLNAVTRLILALTVVGLFFFSRNSGTLLFVATLLLFSVYVFYIHETAKFVANDDVTNNNILLLKGRGGAAGAGSGDLREGFLSAAAVAAVNATAANGYRVYIDSSLNSLFQAAEPANPLGNVLLTDIADNPTKLPALPAADVEQQTVINEAVMTMVSDLHPSNDDIKTKLFSSLGDQFAFEQSMRQFHPTANTTIPNDQRGFMDFCYGDMLSCKDGNEFACARGVPRYNLY